MRTAPGGDFANRSCHRQPPISSCGQYLELSVKMYRASLLKSALACDEPSQRQRRRKWWLAIRMTRTPGRACLTAAITSLIGVPYASEIWSGAAAAGTSPGAATVTVTVCVRKRAGTLGLSRKVCSRLFARRGG